MSSLQSAPSLSEPKSASAVTTVQSPLLSHDDLEIERRVARIRWLGIAFGAVASLFLGLGDRLVGAYAVVIVASVYNLVLSRLITADRSSWLLKAYAYGLFETFMTTAIVAITGGVDSSFYLAYFWVVVHAAIRLGRRAALLSTLLIALCYLSIAAFAGAASASVYGIVLLRIGFIAITALFAGFLSDRARAAEAALAHQLDQARALNVAGSALTRSLEWYPVAQQIAERGRALADADAAILELRGAPAGGGLTADTRVTNVLPGGAHLAKVLLQSGAPANLAPSATGQVTPHRLTAAEDLFGAAARALPPAWLLRAPLLVQERWAGDLLLLRAGLDRPFTEGDRGILHAFMNHAALALENARLYAQTEERAATDPITHLPNHRALKERLDEELARARRLGRELGVLMLDLDHFKAFNDTFGHAAGDEALRAVAGALRRSLRHGDYAARYAGEEFVLVLPDTGARAGAALAERLREAIAGLLETGAGQPVGPLTASIGVAAYPAHAGDRDALLQAADFAMYMAKHIGRNQVCLATELGTRRGAEALFAQLTSHLALPTARWGPHIVAELERRFARLASLRADSGEAGGPAPEHLRQDTIQAITALATTIDAKDHYTEGHSRQVSALAVALARAAGCTPEGVELVRVGGLLHDIGKIGIPEAVLHKAGPLTEEEWATMQSHADIGARILAPIAALQTVIPLVRHHHERWDGQGYPLGMRGETIPRGARIIAICDAYDTMVSDRPYRRGLSHAAAIAQLVGSAGTQFDPALVAIFVALDFETSQPLGPGPRGGARGERGG